MTEEQKQMIDRLRNVGLGYRKIAIVLDLSRDKVRNYCKANGLDGYAKKRLQAKEGKQMEEDCADRGMTTLGSDPTLHIGVRPHEVPIK